MLSVLSAERGNGCKRYIQPRTYALNDFILFSFDHPLFLWVSSRILFFIFCTDLLCTFEISPGTTRFFHSIYLATFTMYDSVQLLGFGLSCSLTLIHSLYVISVRQTGVLLPSSFRFHLTMDTLDFGYILPTVGRIWDFHPLETCAAERTSKCGCHDSGVSVK